jgi:hypothetical protein
MFSSPSDISAEFRFAPPGRRGSAVVAGCDCGGPGLPREIIVRASERPASSPVLESGDQLAESGLGNQDRLEAAIQSLVREANAEVGERYFPALVRSLGGILGLDWTFIGEFRPDFRRIEVRGHAVRSRCRPGLPRALIGSLGPLARVDRSRIGGSCWRKNA